MHAQVHVVGSLISQAALARSVTGACAGLPSQGARTFTKHKMNLLFLYYTRVHSVTARGFALFLTVHDAVVPR